MRAPPARGQRACEPAVRPCVSRSRGGDAVWRASIRVVAATRQPSTRDRAGSHEMTPAAHPRMTGLGPPPGIHGFGCHEPRQAGLEEPAGAEPWAVTSAFWASTPGSPPRVSQRGRVARWGCEATGPAIDVNSSAFRNTPPKTSERQSRTRGGFVVVDSYVARTRDEDGRHEVIAAIGRGAMGEVYRARDSRLDRDVALTVLPDLFASEQERIQRFQRGEDSRVAESSEHCDDSRPRGGQWRYNSGP